MSSVDNRTVKMTFDNASFKKGAVDSQKSLTDLNKSVDSAGKGKGLLNMSDAMDRVQVSASKMSVVTTAALATITSKATIAGLGLAKALTFDPIKSGFTEYESLLTKQNTIMNATGLSAKNVKGYLNQLNKYSDQTIYSFANMTDSITKFVNAGVPLPRAVTSIKGIANAAAFAGASAQDANGAMYAFSQSMQTGFIMLNDWMQIENANMGTQQFKATLIEAGEAAGTLTKQGDHWVTESGKYVSTTKGWRDALQDQWATTEVLNTALGKYADRHTALGKKAFAAAQDVRTFTAFMDTLKESLGSGWAMIFTSLFGNLKQSTAMWSALSASVGATVKTFFTFLSTSLKTWRNMGGFEKTIQGFKNLLSPIAALLGAIGDAWQEAFPNTGKGAGKALYGVSAGFEAITRPLQLFAKLIRGSTPVLTTFFRIIHAGGVAIGSVVGNVVDFVKHLVSLAEVKAPATGGLIDFIKKLAGEIADAVRQIDKLISKGASLGQAFGSVDFDMPSMPSMPSLPSLPSLPSFGGGDKSQSQVSGLTSGVKDLTKNMLGLKDASDGVTDNAMFSPNQELSTSRFDEAAASIKDMGTATKDSGEQVKTVGDTMGPILSGMWDNIVSFVKGISVDDLVSAFNMAVLSTTAYSVIRFVTTLRKSFEGFMGIGEAMNGVFGSLGNALDSFQTQAKAKLILNIGIALLLLASALFILSLIPVDKLAISLGALGATAFIMSKTMSSMGKTIEKMDGAKAGIKMFGLSIAIMALAAAMVLLATAFLIFNKVDVSSVVKGVVTMFVAMKLIEQLGKLSENAYKNLLGGAVAIAAVSASMLLLAAALLLFKLVDWESMGKAGVALGGVTLAVGLLALIPYEGIAKVGLALLAASVGMVAMANALILFALVKWESIGKAAVALGLLTASLLAITLLGGPATVSGVVGLSVALIGFAAALIILNNVEWASIGKIALLLGVLLVALLGLTGVLYLLAPVVPVLALFAAAMLALGLALLAFSAALTIAMGLAAGGAAAFAALATGAAVAIAVFMQTLAHEAPVMKKAFLEILQNLIDTIVAAVPMIIDGIKRLWKAVIKEFTSKDKGKQTGEAGKSWIQKLYEGIQSKMPMIVAKAGELIVAFLNGMRKKAGAIAEAGVGVIVAVINGISRKIGDVVDAAVNLIIKFAQGIAKGEIKILNAGIDLIGKFLHDLADAIRRSGGVIGPGITDVIDAFHDLGVDMVQGLINGVGDMFDDAMGKIGELAGGMVNKAKGILDIFSPSKVFANIGRFLVQGLTQGIQNNAAAAINAVASMMVGTIAMANSLMDPFLQKLDQKALAARGRAQGLQRAAQAAQKAANKTKKDKTDDKAANKLSKQAKAANKAANKAEAAEKAAEKKKQRDQEWENANAAKRAEIRSKQAQGQLTAAKQAEQDAEAARVQANALDKQAKAKGVTAAQSKKFRKDADRLRRQARADALRANALIAASKKNASEAMDWQAQAGEEASKKFREMFDKEAQDDADAAAFEKLTATEKAAQRRQEATALQAKADADLVTAQKLAFTDLKAANDMAAIAMEEADRARALLDEAISFEAEGGSGQVINLQPTDSAAEAFNQYADQYSAAYAAAAAAPSVEFNQYNNSPEALNPSEVYRQTNNLVTYAVDKLKPSAN